jgi:nicotinamidase/pyrazinamidase
MNTTGYAFGLIDAQRGFMPEGEGERLGVEGFGELPIPQGEQIVPRVNKLLADFAMRGLPTFTTQDWHPYETGHFADEPNYVDTWPRHCVAGTPGAELHPGIVVPNATERFYKGFIPLQLGDADNSYTGMLGFNKRFEQLPTWLEKQGITTVVLGGLALDYCLKATALDLRKTGLEVVTITDATEPVTQETGIHAIDELEAAGITFATTEELLEKLAKMAA